MDLRRTCICPIKPNLICMNCTRGAGEATGVAGVARESPAAVARGGRPQGAGRGIGGTTATAASQELSTSGKTPGASRAGTKYPVRGNPTLRPIDPQGG